MKKRLLKLRFTLPLLFLLAFQLSFSQLTLIDVAPGPDSSFATDFEAVGSAVFFAAVDIGGDDEPHVFDPAFSPTAMKIDVNPIGSSVPSEFTKLGDDVFFAATDEFGDRELYVYDAFGMLIKIDVDPAGSSDPTWLTNIGGILFFTATVAGDKEAFFFDGMSPVKLDVNPAGSSDPEEYTFIGGTVYFAATVAGDEELYMFDLMTLTKIDVNISGSSDPNELTAVGPNLYFNAESTTGDKELHVYDTALSMVSEIEVSATGSSSPFSLYNADGILYFTAEDASDVEMYEYDTFTSTLSKIDINPSGGSFPALFPGNYLKVGMSIYVPAEIAGDRELFKFDIISGMVTEVEINPSGPSAPLDLVEMGGKLYFTAGEPSSGKELYSYDGSTLTEIELNLTGSGEAALLTVTDTPAIYMSGTDGMTGFELFEYLDPTLNIENVESPIIIEMFPNPIKSSDVLNIQLANGNNLETVEIYSITGALVHSFNYNSAIETLEIALTHYESGLYLVKIKTSTGQSVKKLIIK